MDTNSILQGLQPILQQVVILVLTIIGIVVINLLNEVKKWVVSKLGAQNYNRAREIAIGLYLVLEDEFEGIRGAGEEKKARMQELLLEKFPHLTQMELDSINKEIHKLWKGHLDESGVLQPVEPIE